MIFSSGKISSLSDEEIIERYQRDSRKKWVGILFDRYAHLAFGVCLKYLKNKQDSEEATFVMFEKLMEKLKTQEIDYFKGWFHAVVRNHCLMILRKKKYDTVNLDDVPLEYETFDLGEAREQNYQKLEMAIDKLKREQAECIRLFYMKGMSYKQIDEQTKYTLKDIKSHIQNGKRNLKIALENDPEFTPGSHLQ